MDWDGMQLGPALARLWPGLAPEAVSVTKLRGEASTRRYYRLLAPGRSPASAIVMRLPHDEPALSSGRELAFLNVRRHLAEGGVRVPDVWVEDLEHGLLLLEDLGDETFEARLEATPRADWPALYRRAVDTLVDLHAACQGTPTSCVAYGQRFDYRQLRWELSHFSEWGLSAIGIEPSAAQQRALDAQFDALVHALLALPQTLCHRDYQSRNLMWLNDELVVIDFQDALIGPAPFDLMALLCDSYVSLSEPLQRAMIAHYTQRCGLDEQAAADFERGFWLTAIQRKLKDAGRFVFIDQVRGNPDFLDYFGPSLAYVGRALTHSGHADLAVLLTALLPGFPNNVETPAAHTGQRSDVD